jgi:hypothetical protein
MLRVFRVTSVLALLGACGVVLLCAERWPLGDPQFEAILAGPSAVDRFKHRIDSNQSPDERTSPLVLQAEALAAYLDPPKSPDQHSAPVLTASSAPVVPSIRPAAPSVKFKLHGTSYYPNQPGRSMALIAEPGAAEGNERWVKEGSQVGHFVIHEIRHGAIVYRDGDNLREMALEPGMNTPSIVRDLRPGARQVSAAVENVSVDLPIPAGPNNIEIAGGN